MSIAAAFASGFITGLGLILPIGAQNAFVLKLGLLRQHVLPVAFLCALMDAVLIVLGTAFVGVTFGQSGTALQWVRVIGVAFLVFYGARAIYNAFKHSQPATESPLAQNVTLKGAVLTCLGFTLLNPHVYLDTFFLLGTISTQYKPAHYVFALGACVASFTWFFGLGYGARILSPLFKKAITWMILEFLIGCIMWTIAYKIWVLPLN